MAEFLPNINPATNLTAYSQINTLPNQSELLLNFLNSSETEANNLVLIQNTTASLENLNNTPTNLLELINDINNVLSPTQTSSPLPTPSLDSLINLPTPFVTPNSIPVTPTTPFVTPDHDPGSINYPTNPNPVPEIDKPFIKDIIPPTSTALFDAYLKGARAWYEEDDKVIVKWPDREIFKSFNKTTGEEIDWLQDRLSYEPLDSFNALSNYINNYHGEIVAETTTWAFVKFPSGGFIKISKPTASTIPFLTQE